MGIKVGFSELDNKFNVNIESAKGLKGDKGDKGDPGPKGDKGDPGDSGAFIEKQYELIEDFTLEQAVTEVRRSKDLNGVAYNFSKVKIIAIFAEAESNTQAVFNGRDASNGQVFYHTSASGSIGTAQRKAVVTAYNDGGLVDYNVVCATGTSQMPYYALPTYCGRVWKNIATVIVTTYSSSGTVPIPAGTRIIIYGVRG